MKINRKYSIALKFISIILVVVCIVYANISRGKAEINGLNIDIEYNGNDTLVTATDLKNIMASKIPDINTFTINDIDRKKIEDIIKQNPYIESSNVSVSIKGTIQINAVQRTPIVRIIQNSKQFYLDNNGKYIPASRINNPNVIIASGYIIGTINDEMNKKNIDTTENDISRIYKLATYLIEHKDLKPLFDHIYICQNGDIELVPKVGNHTIVIGDLNNLDEKFENLFAIYNKGFSNIGWDSYKKINLKFKNQVVCTKK